MGNPIMEERKLNLNTPLLSVRKNRSVVSPNSVSLRKGRTAETLRPMNQQKMFASKNVDRSMDQVTEPVSVPFTWEEFPGKAKDDGKAELLPTEQTVTGIPMIAAGNSSSIHDYCSEESRERTQMEKGSVTDEDERYSDAVDTLSLTDSFSVSCCISSLSGSDLTVTKPSGTFSINAQTQDFMMGRFLPAARAMAIASESSLHCPSRKQHLLLTEHPNAVEKPRLLAMESVTPSRHHNTEVLKYCMQALCQTESSKEEEEQQQQQEGEDDCSVYSTMTEMGCGRLPQLCLRSSLRLLNPVPVLKSKIKNSMPFVPAIRKDSNVKSFSQSAFKSGGPQPISGNRVKTHVSEVGEIKPPGGSSRRSFSGELQKMGRLSPFRSRRNDVAISDKRESSLPTVTLLDGMRRLSWSGELRSTTRNLSPFRSLRNDVAAISKKNESPRPPHVVPVLGVSSRLTFSGELRTTGRLSPFRPSYALPPLGWSGQRNFSGEMRPPRNHITTLQRDEKKDASTMNKENRCIHPVSPAFERTLYVDTVNAGRGSCLNLDALDREVWMDTVVSREVEETFMDESSFQDIECLNVVTRDQTLKEVDDRVVDPPSLPLPSLKSPSESWLLHALPSKSNRTLFSSLQKTTPPSKKQDPITRAVDAKWETIVKTLKTHHDHTRYSEELIKHFPPQYKS